MLLVQPLSRSALAGDERSSASRAPESGRAEQGDRKRSELVFVDVEVGSEYVDTLALKDGALLDTRSVKSSGFGLTYGAAVGVRLSDSTLAVRYRRGDFSDWQLWTLNWGRTYQTGHGVPIDPNDPIRHHANQLGGTCRRSSKTKYRLELR